MGKTDVRILKSKNYMQNALMKLLEEKNLKDIKIKEITDEAQVSRQTFYAHFDNKEELFKSCLNIVFSEINEGIVKRISTRDHLSNKELLVKIFEVIKENSTELRVLINVENKDLLIASMETPTKLAMKTFGVNGTMDTLNDVQKKMFVDFMTGGFYMMLKAGLLELEIMSAEEWADHMMFLFNKFIDTPEE